MKYVIGEKYYATYARGWQCLAELLEIDEEDGLYLMYNPRHGTFYTTKEDLDSKN